MSVKRFLICLLLLVCARLHGCSSCPASLMLCPAHASHPGYPCMPVLLVQVWDMAEGRQPWSSTLPSPSAELVDVDSGVWAMSGSGSGQLLVTGTDEGLVTAWDLRTQQQIWATQVRGLGVTAAVRLMASSMSLLDAYTAVPHQPADWRACCQRQNRCSGSSHHSRQTCVHWAVCR